MRRYSHTIIALLLVLAACGGQANHGAPGPRGGAVARPLEIYQHIGMLAGPYDFPAVANFATLAGPADSTFLLVSVSLPNSAIRFHREASGFNAEYRVAAALLQDTQQVKQLERREVVRVASFAETGRVEESIIFQELITVAPGEYVVRLQVADLNSSRGFRAEDTVQVPDYSRAANIGSPVIVYQARGRDRRMERPELIVNPRQTIAYGSEGTRVYLEAYGSETAVTVDLRISDDDGAVHWAQRTVLADGTPELHHGVVAVPAGALPFGRLWLEVASSAGERPQRVPLLITISDQWMVANFEEVLRFLQYIGHPAELDSLQQATPAERTEQWERFWTKRDPLPATPINEFREQFFERARIATDEFTESGRPGWQTDRGQVFIVLGPPDNSLARHVGRDAGAQPNYLEWLYEGLPGGRLVLQFIDRTGFGRYELTQTSDAAFRSVAARMRPKS